MSSAAATYSGSSWWRNVRVLRVVGQMLFVLIVFVVLQQMYLNATYQLAQQGRELSFNFLDSRAGFDIHESVISYSPTRDYSRAFLAGVTNAMLVTGVGIILTTILGLFIGILRLSPNWLLRKITQAYVEVIRNTPAALQVVFWYAAVILQIPRIESSVSLLGLGFMSNRGVAVPAVRGGGQFGTWGLMLLFALIAAIWVWRWRTKVYDETGQPHYRWVSSFMMFFVIAAMGRVILSDAFTIDMPEVGRFNYEGGLQVSGEFAAILLGLVIYTAAFIAEIVRGSILAISKGQKEAAEGLGLSAAQQLRFVVLPQALRIALPSITNQYLNFWKNTSLAFLIGYLEIINVSTTMINQAQHALEIFALVVLSYLAGSLLMSLVMNILNRAVALKGAR